MGSAYTPPAPRGRLLAFRVVGWLLGIGTVGYSTFFFLLSLVADDPVEISHRFHFLAILAGMGLIGVFSMRWSHRRSRG